MLKERNGTIEFNTQTLLGQTGLAAQVRASTEQLLKIKAEGNHAKKVFGLDISKMSLLIDKLGHKKETIKHQQETLHDQSSEYV